MGTGREGEEEGKWIRAQRALDVHSYKHAIQLHILYCPCMLSPHTPTPSPAPVTRASSIEVGFFRRGSGECPPGGEGEEEGKGRGGEEGMGEKD